MTKPENPNNLNGYIVTVGSKPFKVYAESSLQASDLVEAEYTGGAGYSGVQLSSRMRYPSVEVRLVEVDGKPLPYLPIR